MASRTQRPVGSGPFPRDWALVKHHIQTIPSDGDARRLLMIQIPEPLTQRLEPERIVEVRLRYQRRVRGHTIFEVDIVDFGASEAIYKRADADAPVPEDARKNPEAVSQ